MSEALEKARAKVQEMKAAGIERPLSVKLTGEEKLKIQAGMARTKFTNVRAYVKSVALAQAALDAAKPKQIRVEKTAEQIQAEIDALTAKLAKKTGG